MADEAKVPRKNLKEVSVIAGAHATKDVEQDVLLTDKFSVGKIASAIFRCNLDKMMSSAMNSSTDI